MPGDKKTNLTGRIYLCGFMGCGKTRVGKTLSKLAGVSFADLDRHIVSSEGMTIPEIFEKFGEPHFRELEARYISQMPENSVSALGGGAVINDNTARIAKRSGTVVFIDTDFETCYDRIKDDRNRPLVVSNTKESLKELYDRRKLIYSERADITVSGTGTPHAIAERILERLGA